MTITPDLTLVDGTPPRVLIGVDELAELVTLAQYTEDRTDDHQETLLAAARILDDVAPQRPCIVTAIVHHPYSDDEWVETLDEPYKAEQQSWIDLVVWSFRKHDEYR
jgi:hypothetical protein